jgi:hypothetical protein
MANLGHDVMANSRYAKARSLESHELGSQERQGKECARHEVEHSPGGTCGRSEVQEFIAVDIFRYICGCTKQVKLMGHLYALANEIGGQSVVSIDRPAEI